MFLWFAYLTEINSGLLIFRGKKSKISRDFQGQIRGKIGRFRGEKSQNSQKNRSILRDFSGKKVNFRRIFRGKFLEKLADFLEILGETSPRNNHFAGFFLANFAKINQFLRRYDQGWRTFF